MIYHRDGLIFSVFSPGTSRQLRPGKCTTGAGE